MISIAACKTYTEKILWLLSGWANANTSLAYTDLLVPNLPTCDDKLVKS